MISRFSALASGKHDFVKKTDLDVGIQLQAELDRLNALQEATRPATLVEASRKAAQNFVRLPNDRNYSVLKSAVRDEIIFTQELSRRIRAVVRDAIGHLLMDEIAPWAEGILGRAVKTAQRKVEETIATESE